MPGPEPVADLRRPHGWKRAVGIARAIRDQRAHGRRHHGGRRARDRASESKLGGWRTPVVIFANASGISDGHSGPGGGRDADRLSGSRWNPASDGPRRYRLSLEHPHDRRHRRADSDLRAVFSRRSADLSTTERLKRASPGYRSLEPRIE